MVAVMDVSCPLIGQSGCVVTGVEQFVVVPKLCSENTHLQTDVRFHKRFLSRGVSQLVAPTIWATAALFLIGSCDFMSRPCPPPPPPFLFKSDLFGLLFVFFFTVDV